MGLLESDTTEQLHFHFSLSCIGEGNGNPLQCSCLENPRDGGAWCRTQLKRLRRRRRKSRILYYKINLNWNIFCMHKEICKGHINITFVIFNINIVFKFWLSRWKNLKFKWQFKKNKGLHLVLWLIVVSLFPLRSIPDLLISLSASIQSCLLTQ